MIIIPSRFLTAIRNRKTRAGVRASGLLLISLLAASCASVPQESVELSHIIGKDLKALKASYDLLIQERFSDYRTRRIDYLENEWIPKFIDVWIKKGRLIDTAQGKVVFDEAQRKFVPPTGGQEQQQLLSTILSWSKSAIRQIEKKRAKLIDPLDAEEASIRAQAAKAFDQLIQANAVVTAHLSSIRDVKELQTQALETIGAKDLVDQLNKQLIALSNSAEAGMDEIRNADGLVDRASEVRNNILNDN
jgi:hypothetical protein